MPLARRTYFARSVSQYRSCIRLRGVYPASCGDLNTECLSYIDPYTLCTLRTAPADGFLSLQWTLDIRTCPMVLAWGGGWGGCLPVYAVCSSGKRQRVRYVSVVHIYLYINSTVTHDCNWFKLVISIFKIDQ